MKLRVASPVPPAPPSDDAKKHHAGTRMHARIYVLAGVNGAGKSSIAGAAFRAHGADYFNPDEAARRLIATNPRLSQTEANALAWQQGKRLLERAIVERLDHAFETTLGGHTLPRLLAEAAAVGIAVHVWYAGLASPELHIRRVQARVRRGGHDIPEEAIRRRYQHSRLNLIELLPRLAALRLYDNSA
ncbi:MAG: AAA family ATPase, partial [Burkholderiaceae bacterium]